MSLYEFPSPGKQYKKVKAVKMDLACADGVVREHNVSVYLHSAGDPTFCIALPTDYTDTWKNHPPVQHRQDSVFDSFDRKERIVRATTFDTAINVLKTLSVHWRDHFANRTMERSIYIVLELKAPGAHIRPPSFSSSETLVGLTVRWGWRVAGKEYTHRNSVDDPLDPKLPKPAFADLLPYSGAHYGESVVLPYTDELWIELQKIVATLKMAATRLALLGKADTAHALLTSLASGVPLLTQEKS